MRNASPSNKRNCNVDGAGVRFSRGKLVSMTSCPAPSNRVQDADDRGSMHSLPMIRRHGVEQNGCGDGGCRFKPNFDRSISRTQAVKNYVRKSTASFFGVDDDSHDESYARWTDRRKRLASRKYGELKDYHKPMSQTPDDFSVGRSVDIPAESPLTDSAFHTASIDVGGSRLHTFAGPTPKFNGLSRSVYDEVDAMPDEKGSDGRSLALSRQYSQIGRGRDSVAKMTWSGLSFLATTARNQWSHSRSESRDDATHPHTFAPHSAPIQSVTEHPFRNYPLTTLPRPRLRANSITAPQEAQEEQRDAVTPLADDGFSLKGLDMNDGFNYGQSESSPPAGRKVKTHKMAAYHAVNSGRGHVISPLNVHLAENFSSEDEHFERPANTWNQPQSNSYMYNMSDYSHNQTGGGDGDHRIRRPTDFPQSVTRNTNTMKKKRRQLGMGLCGQLCQRSFNKDKLPQDVEKQLDDIYDHRPYFTYWATTVQVVITIMTLVVYGFGRFGFEQSQRSGLVLVTSLSLQEVDYFEPDNFWFGPRAADLIHLGAKFAPCMRRDKQVMDKIERERDSERDTACCIRNDNSGCVQTSREECSTIISTWKKWTYQQAGPNGRISGSVCGQDPNYCNDPPSLPPYDWPDDITKWPVCKRRVSKSMSRHHAIFDHMTCEVIGHPCCLGVLGECHITTREYCDFVQGAFHDRASLCSQVSCLADVCGMIPFYEPDVPDQFYRLWTSLFLHAGILHVAITVLVQWYFMRDLEKLIGPFRMAIIYIMSGVAGNLASAIFVPYRAEVGPAGSQFGLLACFIVEVIHSWNWLKHPWTALAKQLVVVLLLFVLGLLPWVDNYAHLVGFGFGFLLSYALLPFVYFGEYDRRKKMTMIIGCLSLVAALLVILVVMFYVYPIYECEWCKYLTCLPITDGFCANQDINITKGRGL